MDLQIIQLIVVTWGTSVLPDNAHTNPRGHSPWDSGVHIRQNTSAHVTTVV